MGKKQQKPPEKPALNPAALTLAQAAKILTKAGGKAVSEKMLAEDLEAGAPQNADGTLHLVRYTAWLAAQTP